MGVIDADVWFRLTRPPGSKTPRRPSRLGRSTADSLSDDLAWKLAWAGVGDDYPFLVGAGRLKKRDRIGPVDMGKDRHIVGVQTFLDPLKIRPAIGGPKQVVDAHG